MQNQKGTWSSVFVAPSSMLYEMETVSLKRPSLEALLQNVVLITAGTVHINSAAAHQINESSCGLKLRVFVAADEWDAAAAWSRWKPAEEIKRAWPCV